MMAVGKFIEISSGGHCQREFEAVFSVFLSFVPLKEKVGFCRKILVRHVDLDSSERVTTNQDEAGVNVCPSMLAVHTRVSIGPKYLGNRNYTEDRSIGSMDVLATLSLPILVQKDKDLSDL